MEVKCLVSKRMSGKVSSSRAKEAIKTRNIMIFYSNFYNKVLFRTDRLNKIIVLTHFFFIIFTFLSHFGMWMKDLMVAPKESICRNLIVQ